MSDKPILFQSDMVRALLAGRKTQTRRIVKPQPEVGHDLYFQAMSAKNGKARFRLVGEDYPDDESDDILCPYGQPGDLLWVRETYCMYPMAMPRKYSRLTLKITNVRVERVQEITNDDAKAEGTPYACPHRHGKEGIEYEYPDELIKDPYAAKHNTGINDCWICAFKNLWQSINGIKSWNENPWVWVIEFEVIKQNIDKVLNDEREWLD